MTNANNAIENTKMEILKDFSYADNAIKNTIIEILKEFSYFRGDHIFVGKSRILFLGFDGYNWEIKGDVKEKPYISFVWRALKKKNLNVFFWKIPETSIKEFNDESDDVMAMSSPSLVELSKTWCCTQFYPIPDGEWPKTWRAYIPIYPDSYLFGGDEMERRNNPLYRVLFGGVQNNNKNIKMCCLFCQKTFITTNIRKKYCSNECKKKAYALSRKIKKDLKKWFNEPRLCVICGKPIPKTKRKNAIFCNECNIPWKRRAYYRNREKN